MAIIQSGSSSTLWTIDTTSDAGRVTFYDTNGNPMSNVSSLNNILNALNANVTIVLGGQSTGGFNVSSTSGTLTLSFEATIDGTNWFAVSATPVPSGTPVTSTTTNGQWIVDLAGFYSVRARISAFTSGSMTVSVVVTPQNSKSIAQIVSIAGTLPVSGTIDVDGYTTTTAPTYVDHTFNPLSLTTAGALRVDGSASTQPVSISGTVPVSGTITSNQGTAAALSGHWPVQVTDGANTMPTGDAVGRAIFEKITDGTNTAAVTASSALKIDGSAVTQPISGTVVVTQTTASNLNATVAQGAPNTIGNSWPVEVTDGTNVLGTTAHPVRTDPTGTTTQPISGTVTSNQGTANSLANAWSQKITDGTNGPAAIMPASTSPSATDPALVVTISPNSSPSATNTGVVSTNNSSTATLGSGATFTGTGESTLSYESVSITVMAIGASAPPGTLIVEQSSDGSNWDIQDSFSVTGGTASPTGEFDVIVPLSASNFRIVYTNGATAQTAFRLQTIKWPIKTSVPNATQKGLQPLVFTATQDAKDSGRVIKIYEATATAVATTEAMLTLTPLTDMVAGSTGTSFTVTAGKRFRIQSVAAIIRTTAATIAGAVVKLRVSSSGAVTTSTPAVLSVATGITAAIISTTNGDNAPIPDGLELTGAMQFGISQIGSLNTALIDVSIVGYEY